MNPSSAAFGPESAMYVHLIPLETRPQGSAIGSSDEQLPFTSNISRGCTVALQYREIRIIAQILEIEADLFYIGQVLDFDGTLEPEIQGVSIGSYLRFREMHVFSCHNN
ncbi:MAG: hypothetical protein IID28_11995 [Planctomycetes bacterium]|nr:hypothetical protein [Planctomycetota bacterium]